MTTQSAARRAVSLVSGLLFGTGMAVSGMADPANVVAFLDVAGQWAPDLAFVMGGALAVFMPAYLLLIKGKAKPLIAETFCLTNKKRVDARLLFGAVTFGIGWGLVGLCPGPVVSSLALGNAGILIFFACMMVGLGASHLLLNINRNSEQAAKPAESN